MKSSFLSNLVGLYSRTIIVIRAPGAETRNKLLRDENGYDSDLVPSREIVISKNCFTGCNSIILKGTVLGDDCVVGAGAVVCGKFEDSSV